MQPSVQLSPSVHPSMQLSWYLRRLTVQLSPPHPAAVVRHSPRRSPSPRCFHSRPLPLLLLSLISPLVPPSVALRRCRSPPPFSHAALPRRRHPPCVPPILVRRARPPPRTRACLTPPVPPPPPSRRRPGYQVHLIGAATFGGGGCIIGWRSEQHQYFSSTPAPPQHASLQTCNANLSWP